MKQRIEYIDAIKGLAIFLMVMGHAIAWTYDDYNAVCNFHPEQTINVKMGGGDLATYLFFPYAIIFYGIRFFDV